MLFHTYQAKTQTRQGVQLSEMKSTTNLLSLWGRWCDGRFWCLFKNEIFTIISSNLCKIIVVCLFSDEQLYQQNFELLQTVILISLRTNSPAKHRTLQHINRISNIQFGAVAQSVHRDTMHMVCLNVSLMPHCKFHSTGSSPKHITSLFVMQHVSFCSDLNVRYHNKRSINSQVYPRDFVIWLFCYGHHLRDWNLGLTAQYECN